VASNRIIREQFSEGTTVDGSRIQGALDTVEGRINAVPRGDILPRYAEQTIHLGFMNPTRPAVPAFDVIYPWSPLYNSTNWVVAGGLDKVVNPVRIKGCYNGNIASPATGDQFVWSTGVHHVAPCIVSELHFNAVTDSVFVNALNDDAMHLLISVNADAGGLDRHLNSFEAVKHLISDDAWRFRRTSAAPVHDMAPAHTETLAGNIISFKNLGVAIPAGARVLYQIVIPKNVGGWTIRPYQTIVPGMTVHYLEETV
jgi:hypothetical protein